EFNLNIDDKKIFSLKPSDLRIRIGEVFGEEISNDLLNVESSIGEIKIFGYIGKPSVARRSRTHQHLFLNGRPIQDRNLGFAITQGYSETLEEGTHPVYCLFIEMDTSLVDVNIHPTKMFVRFSNDRTMFYLFLNSIKRALNDQGILADFSQIKTGSAIQKVIIDEQKEALTESRKIDSIKSGKKEKLQLSRKGQQLSLAYFKSDLNKLENIQQSDLHETNIFDGFSQNQLEVRLWQVHRKYIFSEIKSGLVVIDQHLAHARILYEQTLKIFEKKAPVNAQKLLFPQKITLALDDFLVFKDIYQLMQRIGFTINVFSGNTIIIEEMPSDVKIGRESQILMDIIDYYKTNPHGSFNLNEKIAAAYAYKNAVKSGEELNNAKMNSLVDQLFACDYPFFAPDGKPVIVSIELEELAKKFR
ncbi:MAG: hypothetical protein KDF60_13850, partial [Calditrichaeota bacterium]|nr:hypothetical protein [Calditrichota bacterium]